MRSAAAPTTSSFARSSASPCGGSSSSASRAASCRGSSWTRSLALPAVGLLALVAITALGLTYSESDERTVNEIARVLHYAGVIILVVCVLDGRTWRFAAAGLVAGAVVVSLLALGSRLWPELFPVDAVGRVFPSSRLHYPLGYWNGVAAFSAMAAVMAVGLSAHARSQLARGLALAPVPAHPRRDVSDVRARRSSGRRSRSDRNDRARAASSTCAGPRGGSGPWRVAL